jgi:hypothetical protein
MHRIATTMQTGIHVVGFLTCTPALPLLGDSGTRHLNPRESGGSIWQSGPCNIQNKWIVANVQCLLK